MISVHLGKYIFFAMPVVAHFKSAKKKNWVMPKAWVVMYVVDT